MTKLVFLALAFGVIVTALPLAQSGGDASYTPKRINKAVELLAAGEPVYYFQIPGGGYEEGRRHAKTWADAIGYNVEQAPFSARELREFIQGLIDGGPTPSGHRTPAVIVTLPVGGIDEATVRANYWMMEQVLAAGAHGILMVHMRDEGATRAFVQASRYPHAPKAKGIGEGLRGSGGQGLAAEMWGITAAEYIKKADPWPLNPDGELILGIKIEPRPGVDQLEEIVSVPGIAFAEVGPTDMSYALGISKVEVPLTGEVAEIEKRLKEACKANGVPFHPFTGHLGPDGIPDIIDERGRYFTSPSEEIAIAGRAHTKRSMPV